MSIMSIFGQKSFPRSMFWCEIDVIFDVKLFMSMFWCLIDVIFYVNSMSIFGQGFDDFSKKSFSRSMSWCENNVIFDVKLLMSMFWCKITSYSTSNQWRQWFDVKMTSNRHQIDFQQNSLTSTRQHGIPGYQYFY